MERMGVVRWQCNGKHRRSSKFTKPNESGRIRDRFKRMALPEVDNRHSLAENVDADLCENKVSDVETIITVECLVLAVVLIVYIFLKPL